VEDGVFLHGVCRSAPLYTPSGRRRIWEALHFSLRLFTPLLKGDFDVVDCNQFPFFPVFVAKFCCMVKQKRLVATWHEVWGRKYWSDYLGFLGVFGFLVEKAAAALPEDIIAVSEKTKRALISSGVREEKLFVVPNGIDLARIRGIQPSSDKSDIIFAGRLIKEKHVDVLIKALALLRKPVTCLIIGDGPEKARLEALARDLGVSDRVLFPGFLEYADLIAAMKSSKVFVLPSTREGFGLSVLEAAACGLPVVAVEHEQSAAGDLIAAGIPGLVCRLSERDIADKVLLVLSGSKDVKAKDGNALLASYDWQNIVDKIESHFYSVCAMNKP